MTSVTTYTQARATLAKLCNEVVESREVVVIRRRGAGDVALVAADELRSLMETAHLLRSPANAERLLRALVRARRTKLRPGTVAELRRELGFAEE
jgi:antitoxin YefM